jgi:hypothetical protein
MPNTEIFVDFGFEGAAFDFTESIVIAPTPHPVDIVSKAFDFYYLSG